MNEIRHLLAYLREHRPTRERPRHDTIDGWLVRFAQDQPDRDYCFNLTTDRWNGPYPTFEAAEGAARRCIAAGRDGDAS